MFPIVLINFRNQLKREIKFKYLLSTYRQYVAYLHTGRCLGPHQHWFWGAHVTWFCKANFILLRDYVKNVNLSEFYVRFRTIYVRQLHWRNDNFPKWITAFQKLHVRTFKLRNDFSLPSKFSVVNAKVTVSNFVWFLHPVWFVLTEVCCIQNLVVCWLISYRKQADLHNIVTLFLNVFVSYDS